MSTRDKLVMEAARLLNEGGEPAVTLRAVGQAAGVSHAAPYRHFKDRSALLAAVAERDFEMLTTSFEQERTGGGPPIDRLRGALGAFIRYGRDYPARYRLLFSDPAIGTAGGSLEAAALRSFTAFAALVGDAQGAGALPPGPTPPLAGLLYATTHGLVDLAAGGRIREQKGIAGPEQAVTLLLTLLGAGQGRMTGRDAPAG